jgi:hypothetical protein
MYRNRKLLDEARNHSCSFCGCDDGTVVAAHGNGSRFGKGLGLKGHDIVAFLCFKCHTFVDQSSAPKYQRDAVWNAGFLASRPLYEHLLNDEGRRIADGIASTM